VRRSRVGKPMKFLPSFLGGALLSAAVVGTLLFWRMGPRIEEVQKGWRLKPVMVATVDLPVGAALGPESCTERSVPEQFVAPSMIRPDQLGSLVGRRLVMPLVAGDPLLHSAFDGTADRAAFTACLHSVKALVDGREQAARSRSVESVLRGARHLDGHPQALDTLLQDQGVILTRDLDEGAVLEPGDLEVGPVPAAVRTASLIPASDRSTLVRARLIVSMLKGDVLRWQMLDDAEATSTSVGCALTVSTKIQSLRQEVADEAATAWDRARTSAAPAEKTP
jgi:hypothetical protein